MDTGSETIRETPPEVMKDMTMSSAYELDLRDVRGQHGARRALEVAAAGGHSLLVIGLPGCGKTMLAMRLPGLLPAAAGDAPCPLRAPHHTASVMSMFGGGEPVRPGEVSMADGGILFLDELPGFSRTVLEVLREPLEHGSVTLRRAGESTTLPARFRLVAAMNPCPCGECDETQGIRRCNAEQVARYRARVAGTIGEHLHVVVKMRREPFETDGSQGEASAPVRTRIARAHRAQTQRWGASNQEVEAGRLREGAVLTDGAARLLDTARSKRRLSERRAETVLRVARTVADLALSECVEAVHIAETLGLQCAALDAPSGTG